MYFLLNALNFTSTSFHSRIKVFVYDRRRIKQISIALKRQFVTCSSRNKQKGEWPLSFSIILNM